MVPAVQKWIYSKGTRTLILSLHILAQKLGKRAVLEMLVVGRIVVIGTQDIAMQTVVIL